MSSEGNLPGGNNNLPRRYVAEQTCAKCYIIRLQTLAFLLILCQCFAYRSPSVDDFISDDSDSRSRKKREGKQKKRERRHEESEDEERDLENDYRSTQKARIENRQSVELPEIGVPYSSENKVRITLFSPALGLARQG